jgi:hypothetical protein
MRAEFFKKLDDEGNGTVQVRVSFVPATVQLDFLSLR